MRILILLLCLPFLMRAQIMRPFPQQKINSVVQKAWQDYQTTPLPSAPTALSSNHDLSGISRYIRHYKQKTAIPQYSGPSVQRSIDTLWVGATGNDTVTITGTWQNTGPIAVVNNGVLIIHDANMTIGGNIYVVGNGQLYATNSTLYDPQQYFYQRDFITAQNAIVKITDCTLDFSEMACDFSFADLSSVTLQNVNLDGGATTGMEGGATFIVDTSSNLGEIVIIDSIHLVLRHVDTVLLWHNVPGGDSLAWTFPAGADLQHYAIGPDSPGVGGLRYTVEVDDCILAKWAVMPENGSVVSISNSSLQSIGVIFTGTDSANVSGLVDNSFYTSSSGLFDDRVFDLINTSVICWGVYPGDTTIVNIRSCITGEIGSHTMANTTCTSIFNDGSGGYFWSADEAMQSAALSSFTCDVRSEGKAVAIAAYSSVTDGGASGIDESILFLVQTPVFQEPVAYDGSVVWDGLIGSVTGYAGDTVLIPGNAIIFRGPTSTLMSFASYSLLYQAPGSSTWVPIPGVFTTPVYNNTLVPWPTAGLASGTYNVMLVVIDDHNDTLTDTYPVTLEPQYLGLKNIAANYEVSLYPDPATDQITISSPGQPVTQVVLTNMMGQEVINYSPSRNSSNSPLTIDISSLTTGVYFYQITTDDSQTTAGKLVKM